jgi:hypothetical protein
MRPPHFVCWVFYSNLRADLHNTEVTGFNGCNSKTSNNKGKYYEIHDQLVRASAGVAAGIRECAEGDSGGIHPMEGARQFQDRVVRALRGSEVLTCLPACAIGFALLPSGSGKEAKAMKPIIPAPTLRFERTPVSIVELLCTVAAAMRARCGFSPEKPENSRTRTRADADEIRINRDKPG